MNQSQLTKWVGGFFDGDGSVGVEIGSSDTYRIGYQTIPTARIEHSYLAGLFDADGTIRVNVQENSNTEGRYHCHPITTITNSENDRLVSLLDEYAESVGVDSHIRHVNPENDDWANHFRWWVNGPDDVERFLRSIKDVSVVKRPQIEIALNNILPIIQNREHLNRRGFLRLMAWRDVMNAYKGGVRGKYSLEYFENLWGMELEEDRLPPNHPRAYQGGK